MGQNDQKKGFFLWYIHPGEVWDPITDQTRVDVPLYPKMIFKFSFWILPLYYQSCFCLWRHDLQTESTVVHAVNLSSVKFCCVAINIPLQDR